eukprot:GCRY01000141.1.p1 GENE.GCRY01000141.1~~GCRY01000141.1.p1  ORF type:complete len:349 (-),score=73.21 GCRY01000141.1:147-1073(-)
MSPPMPSGKKKASPIALIAGSGTAGVCELVFFHPVDTIAKRLMSHQEKIFVGGETVANVNRIIFRGKANAPYLARYGSLFPGFSSAVLYKVSQRIYKFGGQPVVKEFVREKTPIAKFYDRKLGKKYGKFLTDATAGALMGIGEVALLPFDVLKIKAQVNPELFANHSLLSVIRQEGFGLYAGTLTTMMRNAPGSFALFGGNAFVKEFIFRLEDYSDATFFQTFVSSTVGSMCSIAIASPLDVVKTRIQNKPPGQNISGAAVIKNIIKEEGVSAFTKGLTPKLLTVSPKLIFSFTVAQYLIAQITNLLD